MQVTAALAQWRPLQTDFGNFDRIQGDRVKNRKRVKAVTNVIADFLNRIFALKTFDPEPVSELRNKTGGTVTSSATSALEL